MGGVIGSKRRVRQAWEEAVGMMAAWTGMEQRQWRKDRSELCFRGRTNGTC